MSIGACGLRRDSLVSDQGGDEPRRPQRAVTMQDVADHVGVSKALASMVFRRVQGPSAETRQRVLDASEKLGYRPNRSAALLSLRRSHLIGVMATIRNTFHAEMVEYMVGRRTASDTRWCWVPSPGGGRRQRAASPCSRTAARSPRRGVRRPLCATLSESVRRDPRPQASSARPPLRPISPTRECGTRPRERSTFRGPSSTFRGGGGGG
jgi:hypothetical protein